jgi:hypothetical protein
MILKVDCKILVSFGLVQNLEISDLAKAKVEKVNIAVANYHNENDNILSIFYLQNWRVSQEGTNKVKIGEKPSTQESQNFVICTFGLLAIFRNEEVHKSKNKIEMHIH